MKILKWINPLMWLGLILYRELEKAGVDFYTDQEIENNMLGVVIWREEIWGEWA